MTKTTSTKTTNEIIADFGRELNAAFLAGLVCRECDTHISKPTNGLCAACDGKYPE